MTQKAAFTLQQTLSYLISVICDYNYKYLTITDILKHFFLNLESVVCIMLFLLSLEGHGHVKLFRKIHNWKNSKPIVKI